MNKRNEPVDFDNVHVLMETEKALLCLIDGDEVWIPKSQIHEDSELDKDSSAGDKGKLVIPSWLAEDKSLV